MLKKLLTILWYVGIALCITILHVYIINVIPYNIAFVDTTMLIFVMMIMGGISGRVVWLAFAVYMILDIFSANPFGIELFAGVCSVLFIFWFFREIFTNLSVWAAGILTILGALMYRVIYIGLNIFVNIFFSEIANISMELFLLFAKEIIYTGVLSVPLYAIVMKVVPILTKERIRYS